ncbi:MAG: hypothetical protein ACQESR_26600 [Planctomycetota bacterium]
MMLPRQPLSRRHFLSTAAVTTGGLLLPASRGLHAHPTVAPRESPSTKHFWYRPRPEGPFVDSQRDNKAFGYSKTEVFLSEDSGRTWPHRLAFRHAGEIVFSCILKNGNILFSALGKLYISTDNLKTYQEVIVKDTDGSDYVQHTPRNPERPGWYFHSLTGVMTWEVNGREMLVWGNYCNVIGGASPVNIY